MPSLERADIESSLSRKGFTEETDRNHRFFKLVVGGKYTGIYTKTSHGSAKYKTLGNELVKKMASQIKLRTDDFVRLVDCTLTGEQYLTLLRERGEEV